MFGCAMRHLTLGQGKSANILPMHNIFECEQDDIKNEHCIKMHWNDKNELTKYKYTSIKKFYIPSCGQNFIRASPRMSPLS